MKKIGIVSSATLWLAALLLSLAVSRPASAQSATSVSGPAYSLINARTSQNQSQFFVYDNVDSPFNHGFPSGVFGSSTAAMGKLHVDPGCVYSATSANGCSTDPTAMDQTRGTVLQLSFDALASGEYVGLNFEEPQNWGANQNGIGYNLTGATQLVFDAVSPTGGIQVQFSVNGSAVAYRGIPQQWTTITISLSSLGLTSLTGVHLLFGVATNDVNAPHGGTVLLDNIHFLPVPTSQTTALGLPLANQVFGIEHVQNTLPGSIPIPPDEINSNLATTYEASLALIALIDRGQPQDLTSAKLIADTMVYAIGRENQGDAIPASAGTAALHNGMFAGDVGLFNGQGPQSGQQGQVRLTGFTAPVACPQTGFCLVLDGATGGNNAFAILALLAAHKQFQTSAYLDAAVKIGNWINSLVDASGFGGYFLGYPDQGLPKILQKGKSTENNADIFTAFTALANAVPGDASLWTTRANIAGDFVMQMYDPGTGRFFAGTVLSTDGPGAGIYPNGAHKGNDVINTFDFLDADTFTTLALAPASRYRSQIDWHRPVQWVADHFQSSVTVANVKFQGFDLIQASEHLTTDGPTGIAWEFTGQEVAAMKLVDFLYGTSQFVSLAGAYLSQIQQAQTLAPFTDSQGIVASTLQNGAAVAPYRQCLVTPYQCIAERVGLAATIWGIVAEQGLDPLWSTSLSSVIPSPFVPANGVTDGAGFSAKISGGGIGTIFGTNLAAGTTYAPSVPLQTTLGGATVTMNGVAVPLIFVSPVQINFQVPWQFLASSTATLTVTTAAWSSPSITLNLSSAAPGIFLIKTANSATQGAIQIANTATFVAPVGAIPSAVSRPAATGDILTIYCSGLGAVTNAPTTGSAAGSGANLSNVQAPVNVTVGGKPAPFLFAGLTPGYVGLYQVNVQLPTGVTPGNAVPVVVTTANLNSNAATIAVQ